MQTTTTDQQIEDPTTTIRNKTLEFERQILSFSGLKLGKELHIYDVPIEFNGQQEYIHTARCGDHNKEVLVLFHGYGGSLVLYYKMLKELSKRFQVYCIDFLGLSLSSKPKVMFKDENDTLQFFLGSIEKWVDAVGLKEFYLGGHSLGGYIAACYTLFGHKTVKGMYLFSPAGITERTDKEIRFRERVDKFCFLKKKLAKWYLNIWDQNMSFQEFKKKNPNFFEKGIKRFISFRMGVSNKNEAAALNGYFSNLYDLPVSAEKCLYTIFNPFGRGKTNYDIEDYIRNYISCKTTFFYGSRDWMSNKGAKSLGKDKTRPNFVYKKVSGAGHQLIVQNPKAILKTIMENDK